MQDTEQFKVINETEHFALIELNRDAQWKGWRIGAIPISGIVEFYEFLLIDHRLMPIHTIEKIESPTTFKPTTILVCRKESA